jgi:hypothetical protein
MRIPPEFGLDLDWLQRDGAVRFGVDTNFSMYVQLDMECIGLEGQGIFEGTLSNIYYSRLRPTFVSIIATES